MRWDVVGLVLGWTIRLVAIPLAVVAVYSCHQEGLEVGLRTFLVPLILAALLGQSLVSLSKDADASTRVRDREAFASVALGWIPVVAVGALPFWLGGMFYGPFEYMDGTASHSDVLAGLLHSWFESMSGFTTTGATVIDHSTSPICLEGAEQDCIGSQRRSLILWRSLSQWLGGMGVIMLGLLILSRALGGGMALARAELTGPSVSQLGISLESTARRLWTIYVALTLTEMALLNFVGGMGTFDAVNYSLTTLPSGGFATSDGGIMSFDSARIEVILMVFMLLTCINFSLLYFAMAGRSREVWKDEELRTYLLILLLAWLAMALNLYSSGTNGGIEAIRQALFQAISISSTGYSSADFSNWPVFSKFVLLLLMIVGASAGSTGGGLKVLRIRIAFELAKREVLRIIKPRKVVAIRFNEQVIEERKVWIIIGMISSWLVLATVSLLLFSMLEAELDMETILSVVISLLGNTGPALGAYGPTSTWASLSHPSLLISTFLMWLGRLELLTVLVLLHPRTWGPD
uniref:Trk-type K+ transport system membrane component (TrkH) n=1 Tax=uncultured marine group II/III euryarchaeote AD1000_88_H01 TaxID=1457823 RepID=A0A075FZ15_9EURY|nr:Trk-type K+ transport system membrane component (trkH) [uncultured marine group II/III euryarchaeote AD1000_88_H01]